MELVYTAVVSGSRVKCDCLGVRVPIHPVWNDSCILETFSGGGVVLNHCWRDRRLSAKVLVSSATARTVDNHWIGTSDNISGSDNESQCGCQVVRRGDRERVSIDAVVSHSDNEESLSQSDRLVGLDRVSHLDVENSSVEHIRGRHSHSSNRVVDCNEVRVGRSE